MSNFNLGSEISTCQVDQNYTIQCINNKFKIIYKQQITLIGCIKHLKVKCSIHLHRISVWFIPKKNNNNNGCTNFWKVIKNCSGQFHMQKVKVKRPMFPKTVTSIIEMHNKMMHHTTLVKLPWGVLLISSSLGSLILPPV